MIQEEPLSRPRRLPAIRGRRPAPDQMGHAGDAQIIGKKLDGLAGRIPSAHLPRLARDCPLRAQAISSGLHVVDEEAR